MKLSDFTIQELAMIAAMMQPLFTGQEILDYFTTIDWEDIADKEKQYIQIYSKPVSRVGLIVGLAYKDKMNKLSQEYRNEIEKRKSKRC